MIKQKQYIVFFSGLKEGKHDFNFKISEELFLEFGEQDISKANFNIDAILDKKANHLAFTFQISGKLTTVCDRCLGPLDLEITDSQNLYINFGDITSDITDIDDTMILARSEDKIDLAKHFYDYIVLNLPIKKIHPDNKKGESTCDKEMLKKINEYQGQDDSKKETDPRWDKLKNLLN